jgi:protoporphyrinogen oxidase
VISFGTTAVRFHLRGNTVDSLDVVDSAGKKSTIAAKQFFSSAPLSRLFYLLDAPEIGVYRAYADKLRYRGHITVNLIAEGGDLFPDQWIYVHSPDIKMARLANYNNFSKEMVLGKDETALGVEYFAFVEDTLWSASDEALGSLAIKELAQMGLAEEGKVRWVAVVREPEAYPVYFPGFNEPYQALRKKVDEITNLYSIGRAGMYKYNNQDHSLLSGILAARNYLKLPGSPYTLWDINTDDEYQEESARAHA